MAGVTAAVVGGVVGGSSLVSGIMGSRSASKAASASKRATRGLERRLNFSADQIEEYANAYVDTITNLNDNFDPYDMEEAFNSLYEAVIQPMERDFDENVLPSIQAAYSGGVMGQGAGMSGAAAEAESRAHRDLSERKSQLRFQERGNAIARNYGELDRKMNVAQQTFNAQTLAPRVRAEQASTINQAQQSTIAAQLAADQARANIIPNVISSTVGGVSAGLDISNSLLLNKLMR